MNAKFVNGMLNGARTWLTLQPASIITFDVVQKTFNN